MANSDFKMGVVGVGRMGANIARHLKDDGFSVTAVYDVRSDVANELAQELGCDALGSLFIGQATDGRGPVFRERFRDGNRVKIRTDDPRRRTGFLHFGDDTQLTLGLGHRLEKVARLRAVRRLVLELFERHQLTRLGHFYLFIRHNLRKDVSHML